MELKPGTYQGVTVNAQAFNRTNMELKLRLYLRRSWVRCSFNRTNMELKLSNYGYQGSS